MYKEDFGEPKIVIVGAADVDGGESSEDASTALSIAVAQTLDDETILNCYGGVLDGKKVSLPNAIRALIAETIEKLNLEEGAKMVLPVSALILRNFKDTQSADSTLFSLRENLFNGADPHEIMQRGLALGDRAVHFAAGFRGNRCLHKTMPKEEDRMMYGQNMARLGYSSALKAAVSRRGRSSDARSLLEQIRPLAENLQSVINILGSLKKEKQKTDEGQIILSANTIN